MYETKKDMSEIVLTEYEPNVVFCGLTMQAKDRKG